jgi:hypothetical protein
LPAPVRLLATLLYSELGLPGYASRLNEISRELVHNPYFREIIYLRGRLIYAMKDLSHADRTMIENMLAGIVIMEKDRPPGDKASIIGKLRKDLRPG